MKPVTTVSFLLVYILLISNRNTATDPSSAWFARHFELLNQIYRYIAIIQSYILRISSAPSDVLDTLGLKQCVVLLLAGEIILYEKFARWHMESSRRSFVSALKIVDISSTFAAHEIFLLDPMILVGVSFLYVSGIH